MRKRKAAFIHANCWSLRRVADTRVPRYVLARARSGTKELNCKHFWSGTVRYGAVRYRTVRGKARHGEVLLLTSVHFPEGLCNSKMPSYFLALFALPIKSSAPHWMTGRGRFFWR